MALNMWKVSKGTLQDSGLSLEKRTLENPLHSWAKKEKSWLNRSGFKKSRLENWIQNGRIPSRVPARKKEVVDILIMQTIRNSWRISTEECSLSMDSLRNSKRFCFFSFCHLDSCQWLITQESLQFLCEKRKNSLKLLKFLKVSLRILSKKNRWIQGHSSQIKEYTGFNDSWKDSHRSRSFGSF